MTVDQHTQVLKFLLSVIEFNRLSPKVRSKTEKIIQEAIKGNQSACERIMSSMSIKDGE
jgi:hypothetical protein